MSTPQNIIRFPKERLAARRALANPRRIPEPKGEEAEEMIRRALWIAKHYTPRPTDGGGS